MGNNYEMFETLRNAGIVFDSATAFMEEDRQKTLEKQTANDSALVTNPNNGFPAEFFTYIDPKAIEIIQTPTNATKALPEVKITDVTQMAAKFRVQEVTGFVTPYSDHGQGGHAGVNVNWLTRDQFIYQITMSYGDLEERMASLAKINTASDKQKAVAGVLSKMANNFYLRGVQGKAIYGLLNEPSLPAAITPGTAAGGGTLWSGKTADEIYTDILKLRASIVQKSGGNIDENSKLVLCLAPSNSNELGKNNAYGLSVRKMLENEFGGNLEIVWLPELYNATTGSKAILFAKDVLGMPSAKLGFGEKLHAHQPVRTLSALAQKWSASTFGCIVFYPFAFAQMVGI